MKRLIGTFFAAALLCGAGSAAEPPPAGAPAGRPRPVYGEPAGPVYAPDGRRIQRPEPAPDYRADGTVRTPFLLALVNPMQVPGPDSDVIGLRLDILYGSCRDLSGLDIGLFNEIRGCGDAMQIGAVNMAGEFRGIQIGAINRARLLKGLQIGAVNYCDGALGVQIGVVNVIADKDVPFLPAINMAF